MSYSTEVLADSPSAYWRLDEASGSFTDEIGSLVLAPVNTGDVTYGVTGAVAGNNGVSFSGANGGAHTADATALDLGTTLTIEFWIKRTRTAVNEVVIAKGTAVNTGYQVWFNSSNSIILSDAAGNTVAYHGTAIADTNWHHVVFTLTGGTPTARLDGALDTGTGGGSITGDNNSGFSIASANDNTVDFIGSIDEVALYKTALSGTRITAHYDARTSADATGPVWTTPLDTAAITTTPELQFNSPVAAVAQHFQMQLDTANTFDTGNLRTLDSSTDQTNWTYWNGSAWTALPGTGLPSGSSGNEVRYTVTSALTTATWYRRVRAGTMA